MSEAKLSGYEGFGSFHSANVEELIVAPDERYEAPQSPFPVPTVPSCYEAGQHDSYAPCFLLDLQNWTFLNHGAFGAPFAHAQQVANLWRQHAELQPLRFLDRELLPHLVDTLRRMAAFLHCGAPDLALLPHATAGLNTVLQSLPLQSGDVVFSLDIGYGSVKRMIEHLRETKGIVHVEGRILDGDQLSCSADVVERVVALIPEDVKVAVLDAVTSNTALALPLRDIIRRCKAKARYEQDRQDVHYMTKLACSSVCWFRGCAVLIDAAHALGQLPDFRPASLGAEYVVMNCHKWLCAPRACAIMWVAPDCQPSVRPLYISHGYGSGFVSDFIWDGNRDYSAWLALAAVLDCWDALGGVDRVVAHNKQLLCEAVSHLCGKWETKPFAPLSLCGCMALVQLPTRLQTCTGASEGSETLPLSAAAKWIQTWSPFYIEAGSVHCPHHYWPPQDVLHMHHAVEVPIKAVQGRLYVRLSAHLYNSLPQYHALGHVLLQLTPPWQPVAHAFDN